MRKFILITLFLFPSISYASSFPSQAKGYGKIALGIVMELLFIKQLNMCLYKQTNLDKAWSIQLNWRSRNNLFQFVVCKFNQPSEKELFEHSRDRWAYLLSHTALCALGYHIIQNGLHDIQTTIQTSATADENLS